MGRAPCCEKVGLKRGPWTPEEDQKLISYIKENGHGSWRALPKKAGLLRCGKSCRLRWTNYLRPDIKRGEFSLSEEQSIIQLHALLGNKWSAIAMHLPQRTDNEIKNYWNTHLKKKLLKMGLDPVTHKPNIDSTLMSNNANPEANVDDDKKDTSVKGNEHNGNNVAQRSLLLNASSASNGSSVTNHMAQWESARLEAEARLAHESQLRARGMWPAPSNSAIPNPLNVAPLSAVPPCNATKSFRSSPPNANGIGVMDPYKSLNAVELIHVLYNWEKSLQGQAGMMWPEAWRLPSFHVPLLEAQTESSSCSSPCSDVNTKTNTSPSVTAVVGAHGMDHSSPTSTLCSLESHHMKHKGFPPQAYVPGMGAGIHMRKLSWSDALSAPLAKPALPLGYCTQGGSCKVEEESSTFSSLMQDAMINMDAMASSFTCSQEEDGGNSKIVQGKCVVDDDDDDDAMCKKVHEVACEKLSFMVDPNTTGEGESEKQSAIYAKESTNTVAAQSADTLGVNECDGIKQKSDGVCSNAVLPTAMELEEEGHMKGAIKDGKDGKNDNTLCDDVPEDNERSMNHGCELMMSAEMFKDLPKLKSDASEGTQLTSFALLNDDISDYWSSIMLKEPSLQQVEMTF